MPETLNTTDLLNYLEVEKLSGRDRDWVEYVLQKHPNFTISPDTFKQVLREVYNSPKFSKDVGSLWTTESIATLHGRITPPAERASVLWITETLNCITDSNTIIKVLGNLFHVISLEHALVALNKAENDSARIKILLKILELEWCENIYVPAKQLVNTFTDCEERKKANLLVTENVRKISSTRRKGELASFGLTLVVAMLTICPAILTAYYSRGQSDLVFVATLFIIGCGILITSRGEMRTLCSEMKTFLSTVCSKGAADKDDDTVISDIQRDPKPVCV